MASAAESSPPSPAESVSKCPVDHSKFSKPTSSSSESPSSTGFWNLSWFSSSSTTSPTHKETSTSGEQPRPTCPVKHTSSPHNQDIINPLNNMPTLSQTMSPGQKFKLSTERVISSIPKPEESENPSSSMSSSSAWEYPSPQQFYNALKRKGKEAPEEEIPMMVDIHNFLNEETWLEIVQWEKKYHPECDCLYLTKFQGKPDQLSPRAWFFTTFLGAEKPFDRHDWYVDRCGKDVRYVIDYYSAPSEEGQPAFSVDVRPAVDSPSSVLDRLKDTATTLWDRFFQ